MAVDFNEIPLLGATAIALIGVIFWRKYAKGN